MNVLQDSYVRRRGVLLHVSSLPSPYGIGTFGSEARRFVDELAKSGANLWAILPIGITGCGDSPYQSFSSFALNPYFLDLETLCGKGLLTGEECRSMDWGGDPSLCDYGALYSGRLPLYMTAYARAMQSAEHRAELHAFGEAHPEIKQFALFMAIKVELGGSPWFTWDDGLKFREPKAMRAIKQKLAAEYETQLFIQQQLFEQWDSLHAYAKERGVAIMGDIPIYCAYDSADCWAHPELFQLDGELSPTAVAGVPPDYFCELGQKWGNPLYDWAKLRRTGFAFWLRRMKAAAELFDILRIDHFRGFEGYYAVPADSPDARRGEWRKGCGYELFKRFKAMQERGEAPQCEIIAEDLGFITPNVKRLLARTGYAGMQVLEFAFDGSRRNPHLNKRWDGDPAHIINKACYTGTHDNPTLADWWAGLEDAQRRRALRYAGVKGKRLLESLAGEYPCGGKDQADCSEDPDRCEYALALRSMQCRRAAWALAKAAAACDARYVIIPAQDVFCLGAEARMNTPSTMQGNWRWRMSGEQLGRIGERLSLLFE